MCGTQDHDEDLAAAYLGVDYRELEHRQGFTLTRRGLFAAAAMGGALGVLGPMVRSRASAATPVTSVNGIPVARLGMHVHGSYSEGVQSWDQAFASASALGLDVLYLTDHTHRANALGYDANLTGVYNAATTGSSASHTAKLSGGVMTLAVKAAKAAAASVSMTIQDNPNAFDHLRTGIGGQTLAIKFANVTMSARTMYEVVVYLSARAATSTRKAGQYVLRYQFVPGVTTKTYSTTNGGLTGLVHMPAARTGSVVTIKPEDDVIALWPDVHPKDNGFCSLAFVATTAAAVGSSVNVSVSATFSRPENNPAAIIAAQQSIIAAYRTRYPRLLAIGSEEFSTGAVVTHINRFGAPPRFDSMAGITAANWQPYFQQYIEEAQALSPDGTQGFTTWNHPFGYSAVGHAASTATARRALFSAQLNDPIAPFLGAMGLEVGYAARGGASFQDHLDLLDTFTRHAVWLTATGANDEHNRAYWSGLNNGFFTGVFPATVDDQAIAACLRSANAYTAHPGQWPGAMLSMLVDGVPMGGVTVGGVAARTAELSVEALPAGFTLQLLASPVDFQGVDPATTVVGQWSAGQVGAAGSGTVSTTVSQTGAMFVRPQVLNTKGVPIATGNPCTFLTAEPPRGIPAERRAA